MRKQIISLLTAAGLMLSAVPIALAAEEPPQCGFYEETDEVLVDWKAEEAPSGRTDVTVSEGAPDGSKYINFVADPALESDYKYMTYCLRDYTNIGGNSTEDLMWELDIKFEADGSGFTPYSNDDGKLGSCVQRHDYKGVPYLAIQTNSSSWDSRSNAQQLDPEKWYHLKLIGRFSAPDASMDMHIYEYDAEGNRTYVQTFENINMRNLSANNESGASHINLNSGTSVDNVKITRLHADELSVTSITGETEITGGATLQMNYSATRQGAYVSKPSSVTWSVSGEGASISETGLLTTEILDNARDVVVTATSSDKGAATGSTTIRIGGFDVENMKFDGGTISATGEYVRYGEPVTLALVDPTLNGSPVTVADEDISWVLYDEANISKVDSEVITIENGVVTVNNPNVISQTVTVRAANHGNDAIGVSFPLEIRANDAREVEEFGEGDVSEWTDACNSLPTGTAAVLMAGSWDGSGYYQADSEYHFGGLAANSTTLQSWEYDVRFNKEGSYVKLWSADNGKQGLEITYIDGQIGVRRDSSNVDKFITCDPEAWYHVKVFGHLSGSAPQMNIFIYQYGENGQRTDVHHQEAITLRNFSSTGKANGANHMAAGGGASVDNMRILTIVPDAMSIDPTEASVAAGYTRQFTYSAMWKGSNLGPLDGSVARWQVFDADDQYPLESEDVTIDANGLLTVASTAASQTVYVRISNTDGSSYASARVEVTSSDIFAITGVGMNEAGDAITQIKLNKHLNYNDNVTFIIAIRDSEGLLKAVSVTETYGDRLPLGEATVTVNLPIPEDFSQETDTIDVYAWTKL